MQQGGISFAYLAAIQHKRQGLPGGRCFCWRQAARLVWECHDSELVAFRAGHSVCVCTGLCVYAVAHAHSFNAAC